MNIRSLMAAVAITLVLAGCNHSGDSSTPPPATPAGDMTVLGYYTGSSSSLASATSAQTAVTAVSMDIMLVNADGSLTGALSNQVMDSDTALGRNSYICLSNFGSSDFDPAIAHGAMVTHLADTLDSIATLAESTGLTGVNIDFEGIYPSDRDAYSAFVQALAGRLHAVHAKLLLSVPAKTLDDPNDDWSWPYDYHAIGQYADVIQVMTYDEHVPGYGAGPVSGSDWMRAALVYAESQIPAAKILLGLPAYGYDWNLTTGGGSAVTWKNIPALLASTHAVEQWDSASDSPYIDYVAQDSSQHQVWYENTRSIKLKSHLAVSLGIGGVSMWALGYEDATFWNAVEAGLK